MNEDLTLYSGELKKYEKEVQQKSYFWERMEIFFKLFRIMGYMPYQTNKDTNQVFVSYQAVLWAGLSSAVQTIVMTWGNKIELQTPDNFSSYARVLYFILRLLNTNTAIFYPATWWEIQRIVNYVNKWIDFEKNLNSVERTPMTSLTPQNIKWILIFFTAVTLLVIVLDQLLFLNFQPVLCFSYFFSVYTNMLFNLFWIFNCVFIAQVASGLKHRLANVLLTKPDQQIINSYRMLWVQLRNQVSEFAEAMRYPFATHLLINHISLIFNTYALSTSILTANKTVNIIDLFIPQLWTAITLITICESTHYLCQEIGQKFISHVLSEKSPIHDLGIMKEVDLLLETMQKGCPEIVLGGCLSVSRVLLIQTLSAGITYNIVLSQFDVDFHQNHKLVDL